MVESEELADLMGGVGKGAGRAPLWCSRRETRARAPDLSADSMVSGRLAWRALRSEHVASAHSGPSPGTVDRRNGAVASLRVWTGRRAGPGLEPMGPAAGSLGR